MKIKLLSFLFIVGFTINVSAKTILISDIDDTIKMTGVLNNKLSVSYKGIFGKKAFAGMSELYNEYDRQDVGIYYVSGSPQMIDCRIESFLVKTDFPEVDQRYLKDKVSSDTYDFKIKSIKSILADNPNSTVILVGDDTQHDPEVYHDISSQFPDRVEAIYIRTILNKKLPSNPLIKKFFSSVEIAANEMLRGKLDFLGLENVVEGFVNQTNHSGIQLKNFYCPKKGRTVIRNLISKFQTTGNYPVVKLLLNTQNKIMKTCKDRT